MNDNEIRGVAVFIAILIFIAWVISQLANMDYSSGGSGPSEAEQDLQRTRLFCRQQLITTVDDCMKRRGWGGW